MDFTHLKILKGLGEKPCFPEDVRKRLRDPFGEELPETEIKS